MSEETKTIPVRIAKPTATDLEMMKAMARAFNEIDDGYLPSESDDEDDEPLPGPAEAFEAIDRIRSRGNFDRCVWTLDTLLLEKNAIVDPDVDHVALHPRFEKMMAENERLRELCEELVGALEEIVNNAVKNYEGSMDIYPEAIAAARSALNKAKGGGDA